MMVKNFVKCFLVLSVWIILPFLTSISEAIPLTFSDTVINPGTASYLHVLDNQDFEPWNTAGQEVTINSAILSIDADITTGAFAYNCTIGMSVVTGTGDSIFLGNRTFLSPNPNTVLSSQNLLFNLESAAMDALGADLNLQVALIMDPYFGGSIKVNSSTLSGSATALSGSGSMVPVPEPSSLFLVGSGLTGLIGIGRNRVKRG